MAGFFRRLCAVQMYKNKFNRARYWEKNGNDLKHLYSGAKQVRNGKTEKRIQLQMIVDYLQLGYTV